MLGRRGLDGLVLRYGFFYGPGTSYAADGHQARQVRRRRFPIVGRGEGVFSFVHVDDAAAATVAPPASAARPGSTTSSTTSRRRCASGCPSTRRRSARSAPLRVPKLLARLVAGAAAVGFATELRGASNEKAKRELGWEPAVPELAPGVSQRRSDRAPSSRAPTRSSEGEQMAYEVPDLPYDYDALEPHIDEATMRVHHDKHHQAYVDKANAALEGTEWADKDVDEVLQNLDSLPDDKQDPGPQQRRRPLQPQLLLADHEPRRRRRARRRPGRRRSTRSSARFDAFKEEFKNAGVGRFGSGWAWLVHDGSGLAVTSTANQDSPVSDGQTPLLGVDVWEHAYYLKYQNKRPDYLDAFWNVVNWDEVGRRFGEVA